MVVAANSPYAYGGPQSGDPFNTSGQYHGPAAAPAPAPAANPLPAPATPNYSTGPGLQPGQASLQGVDLSKPMQGETYQSQNLPSWNNPGDAEKLSAEAMAKYQPGNTPQVSNNAQQAYSQFQSSQPANMNPYYDRQRDVMQNRMNTQLGARGQYGSSVGLGQLASGYADLGGQQARDEAQYGITRANTAGQLGRAADTSSAAQSQNDLSWLNGLGGIAGQGENAMLSRLGQGQNAATAAETQAMNRGQHLFDNNMSFGDRMSGMMGETYNDMFSGDKGLLEDALGGRAAGATEANNQNIAQGNSLNDTAKTVTTIGKSVYDGMNKTKAPTTTNDNYFDPNSF